MKKCIICGSNVRKSNLKGFFDNEIILKCDSCDLFYYDKSKSLKLKVENLYLNKYWSEFGVENKFSLIKMIYSKLYNIRNPNINSMYKYIIKYIDKKKKNLEIGPGKGYLSKKLYKSGYFIDIIEPDKNNCINIQKTNINSIIYNDYFSKDLNLDSKYDCIIMNHVFEHFYDLDEIIIKLREIMNDDALLILEVPNSKNNYMLNNSIKYHPHIYNFSPKSLKIFFKNYSFEIKNLEVQTEIINNNVKLSFFKKFLIFLNFNILVNVLNKDIRLKQKNGEFIRIVLKKVKK